MEIAAPRDLGRGIPFWNNVVDVGVARIVRLNLLIDAATAVDAVVNALLRPVVGRSLDSRTAAGSSWSAA
ncbi:hypothetical protein [Saccharopolyspora shandongensis]|uniref:hypothetical protein n=1 Tax=Saccharopolyspora shandongensis TaxID=418495 RepID=UPI0033D9F0A1